MCNIVRAMSAASPTQIAESRILGVALDRKADSAMAEPRVPHASTDKPPDNTGDLKSIMEADIRARRTRNLARQRLAKALQEQAQAEQQLSRADIDLRQMRMRLVAIEQELHDGNGRASQIGPRSLARDTVITHSGTASQHVANTDAAADGRPRFAEQLTRFEMVRRANTELQSQLAEAEAVGDNLRAALTGMREQAYASRAELDRIKAAEAVLRKEIHATQRVADERKNDLAMLLHRSATTETALKNGLDAAVAIEAQTAAIHERNSLAVAARGAALSEAQTVEDSVLKARRRLEDGRVAMAMAERMQADLDARRIADQQQAKYARELEDEQKVGAELAHDLDAARAAAAATAAALNREIASRAQAQSRLESMRETVAQLESDTVNAQLAAGAAKERLKLLHIELADQAASIGHAQERAREMRLATARDTAEHARIAAGTSAPRTPSTGALPSPLLKPANPRGPERRGAPVKARRLVILGVFVCTAVTMYLVPRHWPAKNPTSQGAARTTAAPAIQPARPISPGQDINLDLSMTKALKNPPPEH